MIFIDDECHIQPPRMASKDHLLLYSQLCVVSCKNESGLVLVTKVEVTGVTSES